MPMELLDQLERRIGALLARVDALARENASLKEQQAGELASFAEENHGLRRELEQERAKNDAALARIEAIVDRIKEQAGDSNDQE